MTPIGMTLCTGIGAPEMAAPWVDWRLASEIEPFPRAVLQAQLGYKKPENHNQGEPLLWGDMTEVTPDLLRSRGIPLPDILVAGTPCQAFSIAGLRGGTSDARGNLTLKFVETCHAIVNARPDGKIAVLWENVPGVLSDTGNAFGCFLGGLVGADNALTTPDGASWPGCGMASGPRARVAWRVLDAQYFGVAQRRRRVFVVVDFGDTLDPAAVLFERQGLHGNTPPSREAGQELARGFETGPHGGRFTDVAPTLDASCKDGPVRAQIGAGVISSCGIPDVCGALSDGAHNGGGLNGQDAYSGRIIPVAFATQHTSKGWDLENGTCPTLHVPSKTGGGQPHACIDSDMAVRRLTPTECARLQGFPDDHTAIVYRGKPAADGPQYKALGNSMAIPCIKWIMDRMRISMEQRQ